MGAEKTGELGARPLEALPVFPDVKAACNIELLFLVWHHIAQDKNWSQNTNIFKTLGRGKESLGPGVGSKVTQCGEGGAQHFLT